MTQNNAISVKNLHKSFKLPTERAWGLKQAIFNRLKALKDIKNRKFLMELTSILKKVNSLVLLAVTVLANLPC